MPSPAVLNDIAAITAQLDAVQATINEALAFAHQSNADHDFYMALHARQKQVDYNRAVLKTLAA